MGEEGRSRPQRRELTAASRMYEVAESRRAGPPARLPSAQSMMPEVGPAIAGDHTAKADQRTSNLRPTRKLSSRSRRRARRAPRDVRDRAAGVPPLALAAGVTTRLPVAHPRSDGLEVASAARDRR